MKKTLLNLLVCPFTKHKLKLDIFSQDGGEIIDGILTPVDDEKRIYPIIDGVPYMLENPLDKKNSFWVEKYQDRLLRSLSNPPQGSYQIMQDPKTVNSFGYQWNVFEEPYNEAKLRKVVLEDCALEESYFKGKLVLDAGCGSGQQTEFMAKLGAEVIGLDLSDAVKVAYKKSLRHQNIHIVRGDVAKLPFREKTFDFVYCEGVLHHTKEPKHSFEHLVKHAKNGGQIAAGFYYKPDEDVNYKTLAARDRLRKLLSYLPRKMVFYLCLIAIPLSKVPYFRRYFTIDPDNNNPRNIWQLNYDWYGLHKYQYYFTESEVRDMFHDPELGLTEITWGGKVNFYRATVTK